MNSRGRPRKYPAAHGSVNVNDLGKSVIRAFRRYAKTENFVRKDLKSRFWHSFISSDPIKPYKSYSKECINRLFEDSRFVTKFKQWVTETATVGLSAQARLYAEFLAQTR